MKLNRSHFVRFLYKVPKRQKPVMKKEEAEQRERERNDGSFHNREDAGFSTHVLILYFMHFKQIS